MAMPNIVLNTIVAESFRQFADVLEQAEDFDAALEQLIKDTLIAHSRIIFNGNGYSEEWKEEAKRRGLLNLPTSVDAFKTFSAQKNIDLFTRHGVMSEAEIKSREEILFENYSKLINIEALTMIEMASREIIPAVNAYLSDVASTAAAKMSVLPTLNCTVERDLLTKLSELNAKAYAALEILKQREAEATAIVDVVARAEAYRDLVLPAMETLRTNVDAMETITASKYWPIPTYGDLLFRI
jgi:glutamine synthetase